MKPAIALLTLFLCASAAPAQSAPDRYQRVLDRLKAITVLPLRDWRFHADVAHPEERGLDDSGWPTMKTGDKWTDGPRVLRRWVEIPGKIDGYDIQDARVKLDLRFTSDDFITVSVFSNGALVFRGDEDSQEPIQLLDHARPGDKFLIAVRLDANKVKTELRTSQLVVEAPENRPDPAMIRLEIMSARPMIAAYAEGKAEREQRVQAAAGAVDLAALDRGDQSTFDESLRHAHAALLPLDPWLKQFKIRATGNSHIDMAWLWPWTETVEVTRNTFRSALDLMREYPNFTFTMSSARTYVWMEEKYPELFKEVEQRVNEGRWEVTGGMWVEPDLNMPSGESLVRQILVGKRYFRQKFGVDVKIGWNPDSFGYNWQLPQIYKKSGMDYFVTQKLLWAHEFTTFPYKLFWWQSPDGSRLLTYFPHDYASGIEPEKMAEDLSVWAPAMYGETTGGRPEMMHLYGVGDQGGGPTRTMLDTALRWMKPGVVYPQLEFGTAHGFFSDLEKKLATMKVPTWNDELYFQYHRGVLTTQAETKRRIRRTEELLLNAEMFASVASLYGRAYPREEFQGAWRRLLFDEFHDIMPGSGIGVNYVEAKRNLEDVDRMGNEILAGSLKEIASRINTTGPGAAVVIFNPLSWARTDVVEIEAQLPGPARQVELVDTEGKIVPSQLLSRDDQTHRVRLLLLANVPAVGYRTYHVRAAATTRAAGASVHASAGTLENDFVRVTVDPQTGCITSLLDKRSGTEALAPSETDTGGPKERTCGNLLQAFVDKPKKWDAWNIDADFENQFWNIDKADEGKLVESGPLRAVIRIKQHFQSSTFVGDVTVYAGVPRVDVKTEVDWHEKHILLKVAFPVSARNEKATFEIPYGSIQRPTTRRTPDEQAKFEVPAMRWADLSDAKHGFSLLNDSKYGYDAKGNVLRLSLLRSPTWPDPHADEGHHEFTYSLYPHGGTWREALTIHQGYELNNRLIVQHVEAHRGVLEGAHSFLTIEPDSVVLTAMKCAEDGDGIVLRFYEWAGKDAEVKVHLPTEARAASETDLMERPLRQLPLGSGMLTVHTGPYEINTASVSFSSRTDGAEAHSQKRVAAGR